MTSDVVPKKGFYSQNMTESLLGNQHVLWGVLQVHCETEPVARTVWPRHWFAHSRTGFEPISLLREICFLFCIPVNVFIWCVHLSHYQMRNLPHWSQNKWMLPFKYGHGRNITHPIRSHWPCLLLCHLVSLLRVKGTASVLNSLPPSDHCSAGFGSLRDPPALQSLLFTYFHLQILPHQSFAKLKKIILCLWHLIILEVEIYLWNFDYQILMKTNTGVTTPQAMRSLKGIKIGSAC